MLQLAKIFQDNMILQRDKKIEIYGKATPLKKIVVKIQDKDFQGYSDEKGQFHVDIDNLVTSFKETMLIELLNDEDEIKETVSIKNVAIGEVWIAGGQSNMEFHMKYEKHRKTENIGNNSNLRFYSVPKISYKGQETDFGKIKAGIWRHECQEEIDYFSAVGYYFQKEIYEDLNMPIGIISCCWDGTRAASWMSEETLKQVGRPWIELHNKEMEGIDMDYYNKMIHIIKDNDKSDPFKDSVHNYMMANTPGKQKLIEMDKDIHGEQVNNDPILPGTHTFPASLFENMTKELNGYGARGVIWYQGESDDEIKDSSVYEYVLEGLIKDWRQNFNDEHLPFYIVQLAGFDEWLEVKAYDYPGLRKSQIKVTDKVDNTYLCSITDSGQKDDIHPKNKKIVGHRLALLAKKYTYGEDLLCDAPRFKSATKEKNIIFIDFENSYGLHIADEKINNLEIYNQDNKKVMYNAKIENDRLILVLDREEKSSKFIIKFATDNWIKVNLYNKAEIPAIQFETEVI